MRWLMERELIWSYERETFGRTEYRECAVPRWALLVWIIGIIVGMLAIGARQ